MLRILMKALWLTAMSCSSGCLGLSGLDDGLDWDLTPPSLDAVPMRLAVGASTEARIHADDPRAVALRSEDPGVIVIERVGSDLVRLTAVGVGETTVSVREGVHLTTYDVEVAEPERHRVMVVERDSRTVRPLFALDGASILAGAEHDAVVALYDSEGLLFGTGLAEIEIPSGVDDCGGTEPQHSFDGRCLRFDEGVHVIAVDLAGEESVAVVRAVPEAGSDRLTPRPEKEAAPLRHGCWTDSWFGGC